MKTFDFIVVGGGTSGTVTTEKLVSQGHSVLLLEEGHKNKSFSINASRLVDFIGRKSLFKVLKSTPQAQLNDRQHDIAQAKILGGGSSVNAMVYMRGKPSDYENWVKQTSDQRWGWESLANAGTRGNQRLSGDFHGKDGPIKVSDPGYVAKGSKLYIEAMQNLGLPYNDDFNDGDQYGVGLMQYTIGDLKRSDTVSTLIEPLINNKNLTIYLNNIVQR